MQLAPVQSRATSSSLSATHRQKRMENAARGSYARYHSARSASRVPSPRCCRESTPRLSPFDAEPTSATDTNSNSPVNRSATYTSLNPLESIAGRERFVPKADTRPFALRDGRVARTLGYWLYSSAEGDSITLVSEDERATSVSRMRTTWPHEASTTATGTHISTCVIRICRVLNGLRSTRSRANSPISADGDEVVDPRELTPSPGDGATRMPPRTPQGHGLHDRHRLARARRNGARSCRLRVPVSPRCHYRSEGSWLSVTAGTWSVRTRHGAAAGSEDPSSEASAAR